jgi:hypothetical protein
MAFRMSGIVASTTLNGAFGAGAGAAQPTAQAQKTETTADDRTLGIKGSVKRGRMMTRGSPFF